MRLKGLSCRLNSFSRGVCVCEINKRITLMIKEEVWVRK